MANKENPGALAGATGEKKSIHANAEDFFNIADLKTKCHDTDTKYRALSLLADLVRAEVDAFWPLIHAATHSFKLPELGSDIESAPAPHGSAFSAEHGRLTVPLDLEGCDTTKLQIFHSLRFHGLTEAQADALAAWIWGRDNE